MPAAVFRALGLQFGQHLPGAVDHPLGQPGQLGHVNAVTLVSAAGHDLVQEDHFAAVFGHRHTVVSHAGQAGGQAGEFMVMGGEQGLAPQSGIVVDMLDHRAGDGQPVVGAGASADLV